MSRGEGCETNEKVKGDLKKKGSERLLRVCTGDVNLRQYMEIGKGRMRIKAKGKRERMNISGMKERNE